jgi:cell division septal protein FtsQ
MQAEMAPSPKRGWWLLKLALLTALIIGTGISAYLSPVFRVQTTEIITSGQFDPAYLAELADLKGQSMFTARIAEADARLEAIPEIRDVKVERVWPQTVRITVEERVPWGYWQVGDISYVVDLDGVIISTGANIGAAPAVAQPDGDANLKPGAQVDASAIDAVVRLIETVPERFDSSIIYFEYNRAEGMNVAMDAGYSVIIGDSHDLDYKLSVWQAVEEELGRERLQGHTLDLRFGDKPSVRRQ